MCRTNQKKMGKIILDYEFYNENEKYSDGNIEDVLLEAAKNDKMEELLNNSNNWAVLYHCSNMRENLLEWYPFKKDASLLEVGSGCGALTGLFSRKVESVTCIELSEKRSMINAYRNKTCDNVKIVLGNFQDIKIKEKFDYITLIGVWEYAESYVTDKNPYLKMLMLLKSYLKEDGKILIAIENKMGIKYWNGAGEDHTGKMYSGLNDYVDDKGVRTFSRPEIEHLLSEAGWDTSKFYYPMPDYKLPEVIFSDERLPQPGELREYKKDYNAARVYNFYDAVICDQLCSDKMISYFANSFLVECGNSFRNVVYAKYSRKRKEEYEISTVIVKNEDESYVEKKALTKEAENHIKQISKCNLDSFAGMRFLNGKLSGNSYIVNYIDGIDLSSLFYQYRNDATLFIEKVQEAIRTYLKPNISELIEFKMTEEYKNIFGENYVENGKCLCPVNIDLIFSNIRIAVDGNTFCIDNEWIVDFPIPFEYVLWRAVSQLYSQYMIYLKNQISRQDFLLAVGLNEANIVIYQKMETNFYHKIYKTDYTVNYKKPALMYNFRFFK